MKYMKLGSKPDVFEAEGNSVRYVSSELAPDIIVIVGDVKFYLHKFPLLLKSKKLHKLILQAKEEKSDEICVGAIPGGPITFETCAKFCYGMTVTLNAYNVVATRSAAEYLEMTEDMEKGNLIYKIEVFLNSSVLRSWKDSIIVLKTTKPFQPWADELKVVGRCVDSIASKALVDPSHVHWSYTYNKKLSMDEKSDQMKRAHLKAQLAVPKDWWIEDICDLEIDLYKRVMTCIKSKGTASSEVIGDALQTYAIKWLPNSIDSLVSEVNIQRNRSMVETIIRLLPSADKGPGCSCSFLLKLLKVVALIGMEGQLKEDLMKCIGSKLDEASPKDLLIPVRPPTGILYDVGLVQSLVSMFLLHGKRKGCDYVRRESSDLVLGSASLLALGKLVDCYLAEIALDENLPISSFTRLSRSLPDAARPIHDKLYAAIDAYLQEHSGMSKEEKKDLCSLMDVRKLSPEASTHVVQNERLPLRIIVKVLYFDLARMATDNRTSNSNGNLEDGDQVSSKPAINRTKSTKKQNDIVKTTATEEQQSIGETNGIRSGKNVGRNFLLLQSRSRRVLDKILPGKTTVDVHRSSETSGSSQSPPTSINLAETKSSGSSSTRRRYSIS